MATILITGVTGTVGSSLAPILKIRGHRLICLIRPKNGQSPESRLSGILDPKDENVVVWNGDVTLPYGGVSESERQRWKGRIDKIVHCAASIRFDQASSKIVTLINVGGTNNMLELAKELRIPDFHHLSTAYIAGDADYFDENHFDIGQTCRNIYEATKKESERLVRNWQQYGRYSIYRLGIVVGNSITGFTPSFDGYYRPFAFFWQLRRILGKRTEERLKKYTEEGVVSNDNMLVLPIYINCSPISTLNLVSRDWAAKTLSNLIELAATYQTFHVVHPDPRQVRWITDLSLWSLGIRGYYYGTRHPYEPDSLLGRLQRKFDFGVKEYLSYIIHEPKFGTANVIKTLGSKYSSPPEINEAFLRKLLEYAVSVDFGRTKKQTKQLKAAEV